MDQKRIERAAKKLRELLRQDRVMGVLACETAAAILEAADTEEPEIVVTEEMLASAHSAMKSEFGFDTRNNQTDDGRTVMYRAMRPLEPIPPFTEKMENAAFEVGVNRFEWADDDATRGQFALMYEAARKLEGKS